ncbi:phosphoribosyltransferase domain-containing protein [Polaribacter glomeratus]|uniref:Phosphoribosyltransferase n=1 Tax=Polaribacter glomeratus TaxID=102 RepID=A0A2S7WW16_9FLAO|nr:phosphoribosyltransferase family protein [Polaribacter glomeratus]PQJ81676.1 phosphoribosyltransferase [Polaribacter glomeratus]TXD66399.1 phosphoribosyltransferase [Polaribacter glomeratus]
MTTEKNIILNTVQINQKIKRIAYQIYECNTDEKEVIIAGIVGNGYIFAEKLVETLNEISALKISICQVNINKKKPLEPVTTSLAVADYKNKSLVLVDDVLNSGTTLIYGVKHFLDVPLKRFKTAVLVNRNHKKYPVKADFKGVSLSTSIKEHIQIDFTEKEAKAYLV